MIANTALALTAIQLLALFLSGILFPAYSPQLCVWLGIGSAVTLSAYCYISRRPLKALAQGTNLLREQDFGSRLRLTGLSETDKLASMFNSMMDSLHSERLTVRETNRYLDLLVESSPVGIINFNTDGRLVQANPAALSIIGVSDENLIKGLKAENLPGRFGRVIMGLSNNESVKIDGRPDLGDDNIYRLSQFTFFDHGFPRTAVMIEKLTDLLRSTERNAYNKLIRIMSHEINNSMGAVGSTFDLIADTPQLQSDPEMVSLVESCSHRCRMLSEFIGQYASVARLPEPNLQTTDIGALVVRCTPVLEHTALAICPDATIDIDCANSFSVMADPVQLEQVLVNVVKNAAESIAHSGRQGKIAISADCMRRTLTITDNGCGISPECATHLFTPFYTSKPTGNGGVGLTLTADILRNHKFHFSLLTDPADLLTRFTITF